MNNFIRNIYNAFYGVFITDKNSRYEEYQEDFRRKYEAYIDFLVKENEGLKDKIKRCNKLLYSDGSLCKNNGDTMTEEEYEQKAEEYKKKLITENKSLIPNEILYLSPIKQAYKDGYEQGQESMLFEFALEDRGKLLQKIEELKAQIEKMKCCENCNHHKKNEIIRIGNDVLCGKNKPCEKWELAE